MAWIVCGCCLRERQSHASCVSLQSNAEGLDLVVEAIAKAGYTGRVVIGMDVAASEFYTADKVAPSAAPLLRSHPVLSRGLVS